VTVSPSAVTKWPRSIANVPAPALLVSPKKLKVIVPSVGDTVAKAKEPDTPEPPAQAGGTFVDPTQKLGLAGSVSGVDVTKGLITVLPLSDVLKSYVLPTIVALATAGNARTEATAKYKVRILMSFPFEHLRVAGRRASL
jgi:hypothetical protein